MADQAAYPTIEPNRESTTKSPSARTPIWVWVLGALIAFVAVSMLWTMLPVLVGTADGPPGGSPGGGPAGGH